MTFKLITAPTFEPITSAEAQSFCRLIAANLSAQDLLDIGTMITSARMQAEKMTGRGFMRQTWETVIDAFPFGDAIKLYPTKVQAIVSVQYIDIAGALQTIAATDYALDNESTPAWLKPADGKIWPDTRDGIMNTVRVRYRVGYIDTGTGVGGVPTEAEAQAAVPENLKRWIKVAVATAWEFRERFLTGTIITELPGRFVDSLLDSEMTFVE